MPNKMFQILGGVFSIVCAVRDYDWFMNHPKAWLFVKLFGRNGARVFYVVLGVLIVVSAFFLCT